MSLPENFVRAMYLDSQVERYRGNPLIEALPPIMKVSDLRKKLSGNITYNPSDCFSDGRLRAHQVCSLLDEFFQPLSSHIQLEEKLSIMIRAGYVGRNLADGNLNQHMQAGYERIMSGEMDNFRFTQAKSTAKSLSLIGCSGSGKSITINRILATYPQVIYHQEYNFIQLTYLRIECPSDGSLKSLCLNFFREVDRTLHTNYEQKYGRKRHSPEVLLALMGQVATQRAIGVIVIDEIQRLNIRRTESDERMLEFFVALVNVIGVPVVMVGTPKARPIFEMELQAGRRSAGLGSLFWEPMNKVGSKQDSKTGKLKKAEWRAFTDKLWQYQWLIKREEVLTEEVRDCWFELSQGVLDIVVKLFVLAQLRAISTSVERITVQLLKKVYEQELKPVHPMLDALRRGDPDLIVKYSDLQLASLDKRLLELRQEIDTQQDQKKAKPIFEGNEKALRLYNLLIAMECDSKLLQPLIENVFKTHPDLSVRDMMAIVLDWYQNPPKEELNTPKTERVKPADWHTLPSEDLRFKFSQSEHNQFYESLNKKEDILDISEWLKRVG